MSVSNGQTADATTFNNAFPSRTDDTSLEGIVSLLAPSEDSGPAIADAQKAINENSDAIIVVQEQVSDIAETVESIESEFTEYTQSIPNNQSSAGAIVNFAAVGSHKLTILDYWVKRKATATVVQAGTVILLFDGTTYTMGHTYVGNAGIDFVLNDATGEVSCTTDNMAGTYDTANSQIGFTIKVRG